MRGEGVGEMMGEAMRRTEDLMQWAAMPLLSLSPQSFSNAVHLALSPSPLLLSSFTMDLFIVGAVTFFVLLIGALVWSSQRQAARRSINSGSFLSDSDPTALLKLQLEEILATKGLESKDSELGSFEYEWKEKNAYEAAKNGETSGEEGAAVASKPLPALLLARSMELARYMTSFDARLGVVVESYGQQVPRDTVMYLNSVSGSLRAEAAAVSTEAESLKAGWGATIMRQAMDLTVGLERRKEARVNAETARTQPQTAPTEVDRLEQRKVKEKEQAAKAHEEAQRVAKQKKEADRAYRELMGESEKKVKSQKK